MAPTITISPGNADEVVLGPGDIEAVDAVKIHTGVSDFRADVSYDPSLKDLRGSEVHIDDPAASYFFRGFLLRTNSREAAGTADTAIEGLGIEHDLERNANEHTVTNTLIHDAIADYWSNNTGFSATVTDQTADNTTTGTQAQEANTDAEFNAIVPNFADTDPLTVTSDTVTTLASGDTQDTSADATTDQNTFTGSGDQYNAGDYETFINSNPGEGVLEFQFSFNYDIPADNVDIRIRDETGSNNVDLAFYWNGNQFDEAVGVSGTSLGWSNIGNGEYGGAGWGYQDRIDRGLTTGTTYTLRIEAVNAQAQDDYIIDAVAVHDDRWSYTYSNPNAATNGGGILDGPQEHPDSIEVEFDVAGTTWNVTDATLSTTWDDTTGNQRIQMQLYPDGTWVGASNSTSTTETFGTDAGTAIRGRARFDRHTADATTIPATGDTGQTLQSWEITFDGNDIPVYTDTTLEGDDAAILQGMHTDARMRYTATHAAGSKDVASYPVGESKATPDWDIIGKNFMADLGSEYANAITVRGAKDSDGNRIKTDVSDSTAISNFGREHWEERRPDADSKVETDRIARQVLKTHLRESDVTAEREIASMEIAPGWAYNLTFQDGSTAAVPSEEVHYRYRAGDVTGRVVFDVRATRLEERLNSVDSGLIRTQLSF